MICQLRSPNTILLFKGHIYLEKSASRVVTLSFRATDPPKPRFRTSYQCRTCVNTRRVAVSDSWICHLRVDFKGNYRGGSMISLDPTWKYIPDLLWASYILWAGRIWRQTRTWICDLSGSHNTQPMKPCMQARLCHTVGQQCEWRLVNDVRTLKQWSTVVTTVSWERKCVYGNQERMCDLTGPLGSACWVQIYDPKRSLDKMKRVNLHIIPKDPRLISRGSDYIFSPTHRHVW